MPRNREHTLDEKNKTITVTARIYYQGKDISADKETRDKMMEMVNIMLKETYKKKDVTFNGETYAVTFDVVAEYKPDIAEKDLKAGENIMTVDQSSAGLKQLDGSNRQNVGGKKLNMGCLTEVGTLTDVHEIGHMLGLSDRYSDYEKTEDKRFFRSIAHDGYGNDIMGSGTVKNLNESHYADIIKYSLTMIIQAQKNLLPQYRTNFVNVTSLFDGFTPSSVAKESIPAGYQKK